MKKYLGWAALFGATAVIAGAFGAHALKAVFSPSDLSSYETAVRYQMWHALALLLLAQLPLSESCSNWIGLLWIIGILLFSGSIYLLKLLPLWGSVAIGWLGPITPIGGIFLIAGWIMLALSFWGKRINDTK